MVRSVRVNGSSRATPAAEVAPVPRVKVYSVARASGAVGVKVSALASADQVSVPSTAGSTLNAAGNVASSIGWSK